MVDESSHGSIRTCAPLGRIISNPALLSQRKSIPVFDAGIFLVAAKTIVVPHKKSNTTATNVRLLIILLILSPYLGNL
jgi:hypothetical protein